MADARPERLDTQQQGIPIAVDGDFLDHQAVPGSLPFQPEFAPGAAIERGEARLDGSPKGLLIHEPEHEDASSSVVLYDGGSEPAQLVEIYIHRNTQTKSPP